MKAWIDKLKLENFEHCFSRSMVRLFSFKKMTISTASISENKLSVAYLWKNGSMVIFGEYNTSPSRSDFNFAELWYSSLKKLPDDGPLYSSENWIKKKQYLRLHLSNCCAYKPCVFFEIIIRNEQNSDHPLSEIVSLSRVHNHATTRPTRLPVCRL